MRTFRVAPVRISGAGIASCGMGGCRIASPAGPAGRLLIGLGLTVSLISAGCGTLSPSTSEEVGAFSLAGPVRLGVDPRQLMDSRKSAGPYRLVHGDVLELQMPTVMERLPNRSGDDTAPYRCRVDAAGNIVLPIVGDVQVAGRTVSEIEDAIVKLYYPRYTIRKPSVVASVAEYRLATVSIVGAVANPGLHELRSNQLTLITALMVAGGITKDGAAAVHVYRAGDKQHKSMTVPVIGMSIPARDPKVMDGDTIMVEASSPQVITVIGLVKKPGLFPWAPNARYSLMDALAFAGGVNDIADPQYVKVYRQDADGRVVSAVLKLEGPSAAGTSSLYLKPGDVVSVEQTSRTRTRLFLSQIVRMGLGVNAGASVGPP